MGRKAVTVHSVRILRDVVHGPMECRISDYPAKGLDPFRQIGCTMNQKVNLHASIWLLTATLFFHLISKYLQTLKMFLHYIPNVIFQCLEEF